MFLNHFTPLTLHKEQRLGEINEAVHLAPRARSFKKITTWKQEPELLLHLYFAMGHVKQFQLKEERIK